MVETKIQGKKPARKSGQKPLIFTPQPELNSGEDTMRGRRDLLGLLGFHSFLSGCLIVQQAMAGNERTDTLG